MHRLIDVTGFVGRWPFRTIPRSELSDLRRLAGRLGLERVVVSSFENLFWENAFDAARETARLVCDDALLEHFPMVNAAFTGVFEDLLRLHEEFPFRGIRLLSNYHGYSLDDPLVDGLLAWTQARGLVVQVFRRISDERLHHILKVPAVPEDELVRLARRHPHQRFIFSGLSYAEIGIIAGALELAGHVWFDVSRCRGPEGWPERLVADVPAERLVFGSLWPLQVIRSTSEELIHAVMDPAAKAAILHDNAAMLLDAEVKAVSESLHS